MLNGWLTMSLEHVDLTDINAVVPFHGTWSGIDTNRDNPHAANVVRRSSLSPEKRMSFQPLGGRHYQALKADAFSAEPRP